MAGKDNPRYQLHNSMSSSSQPVTCVSKDSPRQFSGEEGDNGDSISDVEDHKFSDAAERFKLTEEGETFLETIFSYKMEYATRKAKMVKY